MSFKYVPKKCIPVSPFETDKCVYRAVSGPDIKSDDFLPTFVSQTKRRHKTQNLEMLFNVAKDKNECGNFSCSIFLDVDLMLENIYGSVLSKKNPFLAKGILNSDKGIADFPSSSSHINYYLKDYDNNNPCSDFEIIGELEDFIKWNIAMKKNL